ncbi:hypothetical protein PLICRDRAFT_458734 [Plicaturopsis crispa FD-325 SS-3]|nr:hypothetical protein PLICRDRAFT_458734 [Plicaturopsis crispa FD-325 SS-3]
MSCHTLQIPLACTYGAYEIYYRKRVPLLRALGIADRQIPSIILRSWLAETEEHRAQMYKASADFRQRYGLPPMRVPGVHVAHEDVHLPPISEILSKVEPVDSAGNRTSASTSGATATGVSVLAPSLTVCLPPSETPGDCLARLSSTPPEAANSYTSKRPPRSAF